MPSYRVVPRVLWLDVKHTSFHVSPEFILGLRRTYRRGRIRALAGHWHALKPNADWEPSSCWAYVVDTCEPLVRSIGAGMASLLETALPDSVTPVVFSPKIKSDLSWAFHGAAESGRYRDYLVCCTDADSEGYAMTGDADPRQFWHEVERCQYEVLLGPAPGPDRGS